MFLNHYDTEHSKQGLTAEMFEWTDCKEELFSICEVTQSCSDPVVNGFVAERVAEGGSTK